MRTKAEMMLKSMHPGKVYTIRELLQDWPGACLDLRKLLDQKKIAKVSAGLYYKPKQTKYGPVAPADEVLVRSYLRDDDFLLVDVNSYASLVSGLTQMHMGYKVLNKRRHGRVTLAGFPFDFRVRRNFPKKVTKEFLMVDLLDNVEQSENGVPMTENVLPFLKEYNREDLLRTARHYGNRSTERFLSQVFAE